ncbi:lysophospholipid acyltransferase family protein [Endozoicomonas sp. 8E]|uniref:lysophospholipid acyltransferase family protein n=1 Tax=Endozoicomonas sp. 8E TaxID=3035692 RepID=UPI002938D340|nr:lysophospholipid acyltransferase family protein [Endozoicomonas sp. 8E]WOG28071.1 lysophospholipid acyltransferase family protein [Endozoicomonas sp. 8E]
MTIVVQYTRTALFYFLLATFTVFWSILLFFAIPFVPVNRRHKLLVKYWAVMAMGLARFICGIKYEVHGKENIPDTPCVMISNHQSTWETFFLQMLFSPQAPVLKKELLKIPFFGWSIRLIKPIAINRDDPRAALNDVAEQGTAALHDGRWVLIFPEGTRNPDGQLGKFSRGGVNLARKAGVNVLPIAHNAATCWPMNSFLKKPGTIQLHIGTVIETTDRTALEINNEAQSWIANTLDNINGKSKQV